ncbi:YraN family protein [Corallococcus sp. CA047B]|nr:YraN family protein [Corallococcus sp. CA047B]
MLKDRCVQYLTALTDRRYQGVEWDRDGNAFALTQNSRIPVGELDIVAEREEVICFVEVRMRSSAVWGDPAHTVSFAKQRRVVKAALHYLFQNGIDGRMVRFDVISVVGQGETARVEHIPAAFDAGM